MGSSIWRKGHLCAACVVLAVAIVPTLLLWNGSSFASSEYAISAATLQLFFSWTVFLFAFLTFVLAMMQYRADRHPAGPIIGLAIISAAVIEGVVASSVTMYVDGDAFIHSMCIASRTIKAGLLILGSVLVLLALADQKRTSMVDPDRDISLQWTVLAAVVFIIPTYYALQVLIGSNTLSLLSSSAVRPWEASGLILFIMAGLYWFPKILSKYQSLMVYAVLLGFIPDIVAQLHLYIGSIDYLDSHFLSASILNVVAYGLPLGGLLVTYDRSYGGHVVELVEATQQISDLQRDLERYALAIRDANDGIWDWNLETGVAHFSDKVREVFELPSNDVPFLFKEFENMLHPEDRQRTTDALEKHLSMDASYDIEFRIKVPSGLHKWIHATGQALWTDDWKPYRMVGALTDITSIKHFEDELCRLEVAAAANEENATAIVEAPSSVSYEIRTPMNGIIGLTESILDTELSMKQRESLENVKRAADSMLGLIDRVLDLESDEMSAAITTSEDFSLRRRIDGLMALFAIGAQRRKIEYITNIHQGTPDNLVGDPRKLEQLLLNILSEVTQTTPEGGAIVLTVFTDYRSHDEVEVNFVVSDGSIGISRQNRAALVGELKPANLVPGSGGEFASKITGIMGGQYFLREEEALGVQLRAAIPFTVQLGVKSESADDVVVESESVLPTPQLRVLLAENDFLRQEAVIQILQDTNHQIDIATSSAELVEKIDSAAFDVVLLDCDMSFLAGASVASHIRNKEGELGRRIPVLVLTGDLETDLDFGPVDGRISKPLKAKDLRDSLSKYGEELKSLQ